MATMSDDVRSYEVEVMETEVVLNHNGSTQVPEIVWRFEGTPGVMTSVLKPSLLNPEVTYWCEVHDLGRSIRFFELHPTLQPVWRSMLLDWMMEASESLMLRRHTYYLAQDYFDRFMLRKYNIKKQNLQVIGATCLFLATKIEQPGVKLEQLVDVGDKSYSKDDVREMELFILKTLGWCLNTDTALFWFEFYTQMLQLQLSREPEPKQISLCVYLKMIQILDLCILDLTSMDHEYKVLATSVLSHFFPKQMVAQITGLSGPDVSACIFWMTPFVRAVNSSPEEVRHKFVMMNSEGHALQTYAKYLDLLDIALELRYANNETSEDNNNN